MKRNTPASYILAAFLSLLYLPFAIIFELAKQYK